MTMVCDRRPHLPYSYELFRPKWSSREVWSESEGGASVGTQEQTKNDVLSSVRSEAEKKVPESKVYSKQINK